MGRSVAVARAATSKRSAAERGSRAPLANAGSETSAPCRSRPSKTPVTRPRRRSWITPGARLPRPLVSIVDVFNPSRVVVGGGIAIGQGDRLLQPAREAVEQLGFRRQAARVEIVAAQLGDDVGLIGALSLVRLARVRRR